MANQNQTKVYIEQGARRLVIASGGEIDVLAGGALKFAGVDQSAAAALAVAGVAAGYKVARSAAAGVTPASASHTVATGLATVVAVIVSFRAAPTVNHMWNWGDIGDQAGTPAAGSFLLKSYKPTGTGDVTPIPTTASWVACQWLAIGT